MPDRRYQPNVPADHRRCSRCGAVLPLDSDHFATRRQNRSTFSYLCRPCDGLRQREGRQRRREQHQEGNATMSDAAFTRLLTRRMRERGVLRDQDCGIGIRWETPAERSARLYIETCDGLREAGVRLAFGEEPTP